MYILQEGGAGLGWQELQLEDMFGEENVSFQAHPQLNHLFIMGEGISTHGSGGACQSKSMTCRVVCGAGQPRPVQNG
jgi:hypothetical protein